MNPKEQSLYSLKKHIQSKRKTHVKSHLSLHIKLRLKFTHIIHEIICTSRGKLTCGNNLIIELQSKGMVVGT